MTKKRRICIFTGTRAEYGLLKPLIDELKVEKTIELQLLISGMHLSPEFGMTVNEISLEGFSEVEKVEILISSDTPVGVSKAMGLGMISFSETLDRLKPDLLVCLGDRFELLALVAAALIQNIPIAHIHGGEVTAGAYDDAFRHSITKMSHLHFTSTKTYRERVIQLGENPKTVFNVGALGLDNIKKMKLLNKRELEKTIKFRLDSPYFVITFHPVTLENKTSEKQFRELLQALNEFSSFKMLFTKANADNDGRIINNLIDEYVKKNKERASAYFSLGQLRYLSALKFSTMMIGNSSSGIIEMPYFNKPTINIGDRQKGRLFSDSIIQCVPKKQQIVTAIKIGLSEEFLEKCKHLPNVYGEGTTSSKIKKILQTVELDAIIKKKFYDIETIE